MNDAIEGSLPRAYIRGALIFFGNFLAVLCNSQAVGLGAYSHDRALAALDHARLLALAEACLNTPELEP